VAEEEVDGADDLSLVGVDAHHVVEADLELARAVQDVRRAARPEEGPMTMMLITNSNKMAGSRGTMAWGTCGS